MDRGTLERIETWDAHPVDGGFAALRDLADAEFTGAVTNGTGWLFMLNGRVIGVFRGSLDDFETADATAHEAPHPALVLLFALREEGGETQAKYYTDDTPLSEVNETLTQGNFTGYLELSENVLSGDYYVVYYGGRSMSVAFIGNSNRVITGSEAFERANDEVGIYEVKTVDLEVQEIPEPTTTPDSESPAEPPGNAAGDSPESVEPQDESEQVQPTEPNAASATGSATTTETGRPDETPDPVESPSSETKAETTAGSDVTEAEETPEHTASHPATEPDASPTDDRDPFSEEEEWRQTRTVPALDPDETAVDDTTADVDEAQPNTEQQTPQPASPDETPGHSDEGAAQSRIAELEAALESRTEEVTELRQQIEEIGSQRDQLRERVQQLESAPNSETPTAGRRLDRTDALEQTDLFVRYESKGKATLEKAHNGEAAAEDVNANLRLETHTRFDADNVVVNDQPFRQFLSNAIEYRFVDWTVRDLLYEIQGTGGQRALRDLYDVLPQIDRAEFAGTVTFEREDGGEDQRTFDVILRDRMGQLLVVADINDARDPASGDMMADLVEAATAVGESHDSLAAAFLVTSSFFEPAALETADEASGGGFLNRESRKSYVKLARKQGFHLCLIESRGDAFHVAVPEL